MKHLKISLVTAMTAILLIACAKNDRYGEDQSPFSTATPSDIPSSSSDMEMKKVDPNLERASTQTSADAGYAMADSITSLMSSSAAKGSPNMDTSHKFIRTADIRFRVKEVRSATFSIEKITANFGGYVAYTDLQSTINEVKHTPVSDDSTLVTTYYTVSNNMTLRVPANNLDSTLQTLGILVRYLDYRRINVTDATLMILRERLAQRRIGHSNSRLEDLVDGGDGKLRDRAAIEEALYNKQTMADESLLRTLELKDQIALSTINVQIYQHKAWTQEMIANEKSIDAYRPGFFHDVGEALEKGWSGLKALVIALLHFWPVFALALIVVVVFRLVRGRRNKA